MRFKVHHILLWILVFLLWYFLRNQDYQSPGQAFVVTLAKTVDLAILVYVANYFLVPRLLYRKHYLWFTVALLTMIIISSLGKMQVIGRITGNEDLLTLNGENLKSRIYDYVIPHFFLVIAGVTAKIILDHSRMQRQLNELAKEKAEAELGFLKSQINPHFLFNSLNSVYFLIDKENAAARQALHTFSEMLRYQVYELNGSRIPIEREVAYLDDYIALQRLRKDGNYQIEFECGEGLKDFSIEPLLLVPFVENAFKHLSHHPSKMNFVRLRMNASEGRLLVNVANSTEYTNLREQAGGVGLKNVKRRLELLYPGKHRLMIRSAEEEYHVTLEIDI